MARFRFGPEDFAKPQETKNVRVKTMKLIFTLTFSCPEFPQKFLDRAQFDWT